jgi:hypothetical protein
MEKNLQTKFTLQKKLTSMKNPGIGQEADGLVVLILKHGYTRG